MANVERNVKGENLLTRREFGKEVVKKTCAGLTLLNLGLAGLSAFGRKPESNIPSPLEAQIPQHPAIPSNNQESLSKQLEHFRLEETDHFSQEGKLINFICGYALATEEGKQEIKQRVFTHESGATIYVSKNTTATLGQPQSTLLPFEKIAYGEENKSSILEIIPAQYLPKLTSNDFAVVDVKRYNYRVVVWTTRPAEDPPTENYINSIEDLSTRAWYRFTAFTSSKCVLWKNGQSILVDPYPRGPGMTISYLHEFSARPIWLDQKGQLAVTYGQEVAALCDVDDATYPNGRLKLTVVDEDEFDPSLILGTREAKLKQSLKDCLLFLPEMLTDKKEVVEYLKTGDPDNLKNIKLLPPNNPGIFVIRNGTFGLSNPTLMRALEEATTVLERTDKHAIDYLNFLGVRGITKALFVRDNFDSDALAVFDWGFGIVIINQHRLLTSFMASSVSEISNHFLAIILAEAYHIKFINEQSFIYDLSKQRDSVEGGLVKGDEEAEFALQYRKQLGERTTKFILEASQATRGVYLQLIGSLKDIKH